MIPAKSTLPTGTVTFLFTDIAGSTALWELCGCYHRRTAERRSKASRPAAERNVTMLTIELIPDPELGGFSARVPDIPAYGEGATEDEAVQDLREALKGYIETFGIDDALARLSPPLTLRQIDLDLRQLVRA